MPTLLITRPQYEHTTYYLYHWNKPIISTAEKMEIKLVDLDGTRATKKELTNVIKKINPNLILFNGHGNESSITGNNGEILIRAGENETLLKGKIVYALSCSSAKILGLKAIESGTLTYLGYREDFVFWTNSHFSSRPLDDPRAKLFFEASNQIALSLFKGRSTIEALNAAKQVFLKNIQSILSPNSEERFLVPYLIWDMQHLVLLGSETETM